VNSEVPEGRVGLTGDLRVAEDLDLRGDDRAGDLGDAVAVVAVVAAFALGVVAFFVKKLLMDAFFLAGVAFFILLVVMTMLLRRLGTRCAIGVRLENYNDAPLLCVADVLRCWVLLPSVWKDEWSVVVENAPSWLR